jgi:hypothetical protein
MDPQSAVDVAHVIQAISKIRSSEEFSTAASSMASRSIFEQARWYTAAFFVTYSFAAINHILQFVGINSFLLMFLQSLFIPLQVSSEGPTRESKE